MLPSRRRCNEGAFFSLSAGIAPSLRQVAASMRIPCPRCSDRSRRLLHWDLPYYPANECRRILDGSRPLSGGEEGDMLPWPFPRACAIAIRNRRHGSQVIARPLGDLLGGEDDGMSRTDAISPPYDRGSIRAPHKRLLFHAPRDDKHEQAPPRAVVVAYPMLVGLRDAAGPLVRFQPGGAAPSRGCMCICE